VLVLRWELAHGLCVRAYLYHVDETSTGSH